jgi:hypothetical protein
MRHARCSRRQRRRSESRNLPALAATLHSIADLELDEGQLAVAEECYAESLSVARTGVVGQGQRITMYCLAGLAVVAAARGDAERAGLLWGTVQGLEERLQCKLWPIEGMRYDEFIATVAGSATFDEAASAGREPSLEQAVEYAARYPVRRAP